MAEIDTIVNTISYRAIPAAIPAVPGSIAVENIAGIMKLVDDQGRASPLASGGAVGLSIFFCADSTAGNDATAVASTSLAAAAANPFKTIASIRIAMGNLGNGGKAIILLKSGAFNEDIDLQDPCDFKEILVCGTTDFSRTPTDKFVVGDQVAAGTSASGYNVVATLFNPSAVDFTVSPLKVTAAAHGLVTGDCVFGSGFVPSTAAAQYDTALNGYWVVTVVDANTFTLNASTNNNISGNVFATVTGSFKRWTLTDVGGNPVTFTADALVGKRFRWSPTTTTTALRNTAQPIAMNTANSLIFGIAVVGGTIAAGDVGFITEPGVDVNIVQTAFVGPGVSNATTGTTGNQPVQFVGIRAVTWGFAGMDRTVFCEGKTSFASRSSAVGGVGGFQAATLYADEGGASIPSMGVGFLALSTSTAVFSSYQALLSQFFTTKTAATVTFGNVLIGTITGGAFLGGLELNGCGTPQVGSGLSNNGLWSIGGSLTSPRIVASSGNTALGILASSVNIASVDVSGASAVDKAGIGVGGTGSVINFSSGTTAGGVSGRGNNIGLNFGTVGTSVFNSARRATVNFNPNGQWGLFSNAAADFCMGNNAFIQGFPFVDSFNGTFQDSTFSICDNLDNFMGPPPATNPYCRLIRCAVAYSNNTGSTINRANFVRLTTGGTDTLQRIIPAKADSSANAKGLLGPVVTNSLTAAQAMLSAPGQPGIFLVDLTGGHVAAVVGDTFYLSQTTAGLVQTDAPGSGVVVKVGLAIGPSDASGYTWGMVGPPMA